jgi:hypothetical protein
VLYCEIPKDGKYIIEIHDSVYRGREDFVYRLTIGEIPFITSIFPLGGRVGSPMNVHLTGWNLPVDSIRLEPTFDRGRTLRTISLNQENAVSNRVPFIMDVLPEIVEKEPNDTPEAAQTVGSAVIINGRIDRPDDVDYFRIEGHGVIVAEVFARRLGSPLDSIIRLYDASGKEVAVNDDYEDKSWPLITHHADSRFQVNSTGVHYLSIADAQRRGGPEFGYRLYVRAPRPDFDLRVTPSSIIAPCGGTVAITAHAFRKDGFIDDIALELENAPPGFALSGAWVPGSQDKVRLTLTVPPKPTEEPLILQMNGHSMGRGRRISRPVFPAEAMTQAFAYQHVVPTKDWTVAVTAKGGGGKVPCASVDNYVRIVSGGTTQVHVLGDKGCKIGDLRFELSEPPDGVTCADPVSMGPGVAIPVKCDAAKIKPGLKGNLLFAVSREWTSKPEPKKKPQTGRSVIGMMPAVPFEVVAGGRH